MIGTERERERERELGKFVKSVWLGDDDDDDIYVYVCACECKLLLAQQGKSAYFEMNNSVNESEYIQYTKYIQYQYIFYVRIKFCCEIILIDPQDALLIFLPSFFSETIQYNVDFLHNCFFFLSD